MSEDISSKQIVVCIGDDGLWRGEDGKIIVFTNEKNCKKFIMRGYNDDDENTRIDFETYIDGLERKKRMMDLGMTMIHQYPKRVNGR